MLPPEVESQIATGASLKDRPLMALHIDIAKRNPLTLVPFFLALAEHYGPHLVFTFTDSTPSDQPTPTLHRTIRNILLDPPLSAAEVLSRIATISPYQSNQPDWYSLARQWQATQPHWDDPTKDIPLVEYCR